MQKNYGDARRTRISSDEGESEYTAEDFIVDEDNVVLVSRDGWVKRQKEVKDVSTTRVREGDTVLAVLPGSTRATVVFFSNFGVAYSARGLQTSRPRPAMASRSSDSSSCSDGERIVAALSLDPRVSGTIAAKKEGDVPPVHARCRDERRLQPALQPRTVRRTRAPGQGGDSRGRRKGRRSSASAV